MNRGDLQKLSNQRRKEALVLLRAKQYQGAYYLAGYSVECALKSCISKQTKRHDFPDKKFAMKVFTHDIRSLVRAAGLEQQLGLDVRGNNHLEINWTIVKDWSEQARYKLAISRREAEDLYSACTSRTNGVLPWVRKHW